MGPGYPTRAGPIKSGSSAAIRSRCGTTVYLGSRADARPASNTPNRVTTELATNVAPQSADTARERPLSVETTVAPSVIRDASRINRPGRPRS